MKISLKIILLLLTPLLYNISKMHWNMKYEGYYINPVGVLFLGVFVSCIMTISVIKLPVKKKI